MYILHSDDRICQNADHLITCGDSVIRKHPECGVIITGDFNQMNDSFLKTHYKFSQIVKVATRGQAILDKIWTNVNMVYYKPVTVAELGTSDHNIYTTIGDACVCVCVCTI